MPTPGRAEQVRALSQLVAAPLTPAAIFLVVTVNRGAEPEGAVRAKHVHRKAARQLRGAEPEGAVRALSADLGV